MSKVTFISSKNFLKKLPGTLISAINSTVFLFLDLLDYLLCIFYRLLDEFFEGDPSPCYCEQKRGSFSSELSESLYGRENVFRGKPFPGKVGSRDGKKRGIRWSDCGCESCGSWMNNVDQRLHVVVREPSKAIVPLRGRWQFKSTWNTDEEEFTDEHLGRCVCFLVCRHQRAWEWILKLLTRRSL